MRPTPFFAVGWGLWCLTRDNYAAGQWEQGETLCRPTSISVPTGIWTTVWETRSRSFGSGVKHCLDD